MDSGIECSLTQFVSDTKLCSVVNMLKERDAIQGDLNTLERWVYVNLLKFNKAKFKVLHLGWGNPKHKYTLGKWIESSLEEKDLEVFLRMLVDKKFNMTINVLLQPRKPPMSWAASKAVWVAGEGGDSPPLLCS
ncbi:rna-directed dna polymerase from mobile element jockey-like [Willisornis vidua]|uniref:Rna-directed dna polymerase from mobile element jockey-like n=1 Tax=Willisornis vidua TaxID=1566151 RepID=A0ABQ9DIB2_9PASS|nr:rna-directed dna polymerase from mobile element jockey-like [Willisornis vidua]